MVSLRSISLAAFALATLVFSSPFPQDAPVIDVQTTAPQPPTTPKTLSFQRAEALKKFICLLNAERASRDLPPLGYDARLDTFARNIAKDFADSHSIFGDSDDAKPYDLIHSLRSNQIEFGVVRQAVTFQCFSPQGCLRAFLNESNRSEFLDSAVNTIGLGSFENFEDFYVGAVLIGDGKHAHNVPQC